MVKKRCLLLTTHDKRNFLTHTEYLPQLVEFSNTFNVSMSIVQVEEPTLLDLEKLAPAICGPAQPQPSMELETELRPDNIQLYMQAADAEVIPTAVPDKPKKDKKRKEKPKEVIRTDIYNIFTQGEVVDVKQIAKKYNKFKFKLCTFSNHVKHVRDKLRKEGHEINKLKPGRYQLVF